ncbi:hypothetical protein GCM10007424_16850 [Flavobacterium suaedae]|uniref:DUF2750 domain-containing protein n=1 Tax=Flavobacterium suaedae TaxID=1767027 RepID=A0ABQ1JUG9_9FLAO|nr:DUF6508 domain-containing protein [Flavobacterium suaedae]GGB77418.1 hypothetical protein GCM10007424_16850 [Flavobacterium suaedae]
MIELKDFSKHLNSIKYEKWQLLFDTIPVIEQTEEFGKVQGGDLLEDGSITFPYWSSAEIVDKVFDLISDLNIAPAYNWMKWKEGSRMLNSNTIVYKDLDIITLCKFLTILIRMDRFNEGYLISRFKDGTMLNIVKAIKYKVNNRDY